MRALLLLVVSCLGCEAERIENPTTPKDDSFTRQIREASQRMHDRYQWASQIQREIAQGDLELARASARVITKLDEPYALPTWQPFLAAVHDAARQLELATDPMLSARNAGVLGQRCAECHEATKARVQFPNTAPPPDDPKLAPQMLGHQWAAAQMWDGLIGPAPERWNRGAQALTTVPLNLVAAAVTRRYDGDVDDVARIRELARNATSAKTTAERGELYGKLLAACVHCHTILRDH